MFIAVYNMYEPCELHEIFPCALCNGDAKKLEESTRTPSGGNAPCIAPGIYLAQFPGRCASCGLNYGEESPIRYDNEAGGWTAMGCCG